MPIRPDSFADRSASAYAVPRRALLKIGALGAGLTCEQLLRSRVAGAAPPNAAAAAATKPVAAARDSAAILFWLAGGPSHIDMYDMKPAAPIEVRGPFRPIETTLPGLLVNELMPRQARIADRLSIVRSVTHNLAVHDDGSHWLQTGYPLLDARARGQQNPCEGSIVSRLRGPNRPGMPAYVCVPEDYQTHMGFYQAAAYLGKRYDAVNASAGGRSDKYRAASFVPPLEVTADRLSDRRKLLDSFDAWRRHADASDRLRDADEVQQYAFELMGSRAAREAFDLAREPDRQHERYGRHLWGQAALLARRLVEAGVTFVTINFYEKDVDWWDDHYKIEQNLTKRLPPYDQAIAALIDDLHDRGQAQRVLVAAYGEFGRAPRIDNNAGRGHWPRAMAALLSGAGIRPGQIIGGTTPDGGEPNRRPLRPGDLLATIYHALGIDHHDALPDRLGRPIPLVPEGEPIRELVGCSK